MRNGNFPPFECAIIHVVSFEGDEKNEGAAGKWHLHLSKEIFTVFEHLDNLPNFL